MASPLNNYSMVLAQGTSHSKQLMVLFLFAIRLEAIAISNSKQLMVLFLLNLNRCSFASAVRQNPQVKGRSFAALVTEGRELWRKELQKATAER